MCGRYVFKNIAKLGQRFCADNTLIIKPSYNVVPGNLMPVIIRKNPNQAVLMKWGLVPFWAKDPRIGYKMINARSEEIHHKPSFRKPIRCQRCLVPADGFYEWQRQNQEKIPFYLALKNQESFALAGIYDQWRDAENKTTFSFSIITTQPNSLVAKIHNRMPVILKKADEDKWLDLKTDLTKILQLLQPYPASQMTAWPVGKEVNNPENNSLDLIKKYNSST